MSKETQAILSALAELRTDVALVAERLDRLDAGLELVRCAVLGLGQRTTALEREHLTPIPSPRDSWATPDLGGR